ncbi:hypothetical protein PBI_MEGABEAR_39 [Mycobacterium phage Megabear]|nr:hypothetical protein PBI_MEGABEAR_39 [Mycobacterium phage Megabear]WRQ08215.1 hypothetical protein JDBV14_00505 [Mycobacterium phage harman]BBC28563.1 hypothetical protein [Mycobacterium phage D12]BBC28653.1 hypothetical protein [Mycobacterium phage PR]
MNDPADAWDGERPVMTLADKAIAAAVAAGSSEVPAWQPIAAGIAVLIERYYANAADATQEAAITNLAGLLRHASAFNAAVCREVEHYATEAREAREALQDARTTIANQADELAELQKEAGWG